MATIKAIDGRSVHQIQSGQVIIDLCSVVKELVENSVDAGATIIDVRFKNQGLDLIEIQDNGSGITPANYASVALKHYTSKLSTYADISSLQTFGFRGEALSSLCALSTLSITTCLAEDVPKGSKLTFETSGKLQSTSVVAAQRGTTVSIEKLFHNLPVRRRELERNIKREWHKVIALLNQYACIQTGLKFSVSQQPTKGKRILLFSTKGNHTTKDNIINIFGAKTVNALVALDLKLELQPTVSRIALQAASEDPEADVDESKEVQVLGFVSRPVHGEGRQTPDRQMFFVNGRPCGLPQFARTFNEVYKSYNYLQSPFIFADIRLDTNMYDVNVSPDKRSILLHDQNNMLDNLRTALTELFDQHDFSVPLAQLGGATPQPSQKKVAQVMASFRATESPSSASSQPTPERKEKNEQPRGKDDEDADDRESVTSDEDNNESDANAKTPSQQEIPRNRSMPQVTTYSAGRSSSQSLISRWAAKKLDIDEDDEQGRTLPRRGRALVAISDEEAEVDSDPISDDEQEMSPPDIDKPLPVQDFNRRLAEQTSGTPTTYRAPPLPFTQPPSQESPIPASQPMRIHNYPTFSPRKSNVRKRDDAHVRVTIGDEEDDDEEDSFVSKRARLSEDEDEPEIDADDSIDQQEEGEEEHVEEKESIPEQGSSEASPEADGPADKSMESVNDEKTADMETNEILQDTAEAPTRKFDVFQAGSRKNNTTLLIQQTVAVNSSQLGQQAEWFNAQLSRHKTSHSAVDNVEDISASDAESKLQLIISKGDFGRMKVAGQFNLGFIIAVRPGTSKTKSDDELFIIDQHASDEKYNFERLQSTTVVQSQRLVHPKRLQLTALEEEVVIENLQAIEANGFKISVDDSGDEPVGSRCELTALPLSRETAFSLEDLEELIALLSDSPESSHIPRPAKVRKMFAMRACRSSVMIGKALNTAQMYNLVRHMGELDKPWNCPHGRPTMRHLCRLQAWDDNRWQKDTELDSLSSWKHYAKQ